MPQAQPEDNISIKRKRLTFRSWHRGTREIDLMLGRFADECLPGFDEAQLALYDSFLSNSDPDIFNWISGAEPVPVEEDNAVVRRLLAFYEPRK